MANKSLKQPVFVAGLLLVLAATTLRAQVVPAPARDQLLNGLTVLYASRPGESNVFLRLRIQSGAAFDLAGKAGTMALLGDAFFPDAETREFVREQLGGTLEVSTSFDAVDITLSGKASEFERMVEMIRNAVIQTNLSAENVTTLRAARVKDLEARQANAASIADRAVATRLFGTFPYANPVGGSTESVGRVERADLMLSRERFLHADNATLVVIGGVERPRLMRAARQLLGSWAKSDRTIPATFRQPGAPDARVLLVNQTDAKTAEIRIAVRGLAQSDRDAAAASLLASILVDRWQAAIPELSTAFARHEAYLLPGMFVAGGATPSAAMARAINAAQEAMRLLVLSGPTAAELERARTRQLAQMNLDPNQPSTMATLWLDSETYKIRDLNPTGEISRVTVADVQRVANRLFKDTPRATVVVGQVADLKAQLGTNVEIPSEAPKVNPASTPPPVPARKP